MRTRSPFGYGRFRRVLGKLRGRRGARGEAILRQKSALMRRRPKSPTRFHRSTDNDLEMITLWSSTISA